MLDDGHGASYHLTDAKGCRVYPPWMKEELRDGKIDNDLVVKYLLGETKKP